MKGRSQIERRELRGTIARRIMAGHSAVAMAAEYDVPVGYIRRACARCGVEFRYNEVATEPTQPPVTIELPYAPKPRTQSVWDCVNWERQDVEIARVLRVSRERVRQIRRLRGEKDGGNKWFGGVARVFRDWVRSKSQELHGLSVPEIMGRFDRPVSVTVARHVIAAEGIRLASRTRGQFTALPWDQIDWRLCNADLFEIWGTVCGAQRFSARRCNFRLGPASLIDGPEADAARAAEKQKAEAWFKTPDGKIAKAGSRAYASAS